MVVGLVAAMDTIGDSNCHRTVSVYVPCACLSHIDIILEGMAQSPQGDGMSKAKPRLQGDLRNILRPYRYQWCGCIEGDLSETYEQTEIKVIEEIFEYIHQRELRNALR